MSRNPRNRSYFRQSYTSSLLNGEMNNGVLMAAAGKYGYYLGEVTLDIEDKRIINKKQRYIQ